MPFCVGCHGNRSRSSRPASRMEQEREREMQWQRWYSMGYAGYPVGYQYPYYGYPPCDVYQQAVPGNSQCLCIFDDEFVCSYGVSVCSFLMSLFNGCNSNY